MTPGVDKEAELLLVKAAEMKPSWPPISPMDHSVFMFSKLSRNF